MHAGESLWNLYALVTGLERRFGTEPSVLKALAGARNDLKTISDFISVPPPSDAELGPRVPQFERPKEAASAPPPSSSPSQPSGKLTPEGSEGLAICDSILEDISEMPDRAMDFAESIMGKVSSMKESIEKYGNATPKMINALQNMRHAQLKWMNRD